MKEIRPYGSDDLLYVDNNSEIHLMSLHKGATSSIHRHKKINWFYCLEGKIEIRVYNDDAETIDYAIVLSPGEKCKVSSPRLHQFYALEPTTLLEVYAVKAGEKIDVDDIERVTVGGLFP